MKRMVPVVRFVLFAVLTGKSLKTEKNGKKSLQSCLVAMLGSAAAQRPPHYSLISASLHCVQLLRSPCNFLPWSG
jgi:hypothetical protein